MGSCLRRSMSAARRDPRYNLPCASESRRKSLLRRTARYPFHLTTRPELSPFFGPPATCDSMAHAPRAWHGAAIASATVQRHSTAAADPRPALLRRLHALLFAGLLNRAEKRASAGQGWLARLVSLWRGRAQRKARKERARPPCVCVFVRSRSCSEARLGSPYLCPPSFAIVFHAPPPEKPCAFARRKGTQKPTRVVEKTKLWDSVHRSEQIRCSIVVSISACHAEDPGSIPEGGVKKGHR